MMKSKAENEKYEAAEAQARFEAALRGALKTPPKHLKEKPKLARSSRAPTKKTTRKP
jgi:hypothetical protein